MAAASPFGLSAPQDLAAAMKYGPNTAQALQRSSYLSDALRAMMTEGSQNIHSGGELAAKLIAAAIMNRNYMKSQQALMGAVGADQKAEVDSAIRGTPADPNYSPPQVATQPPAPPTQPVEPAPAPAQPPQQEAPDQGPQAAPAPAQGDLPRGLRNNNPLNLKGTVAWHNMTGVDPAGYAIFATPQDGMNAADHNLQAYATHHGLNTVNGIVGRWAPAGADGNAPGDYAGFVAKQLGVDPSTPLNMADPAVRQQIMGAMGHFENGRPLPQFGQLAQGGPQGVPGAATAFPPPSAPGVSPLAQGAVPAGVPPQASPAGATSPSPQVPHQTVTPEEWMAALHMAQDWHTRDLGLAELAKLKMRAAGAMEAPKNMMWSQAAGRYVPMPGTETTQIAGQSPSDAAQRDAFGAVTHATIPGVQGAIPEGMVRDPNTGSYVHVGTQQQQTFRIPGANGVFVMGPNGTPQKVAEDQYGPEQLLKMRQDLLTAEPVKLYQQAADAYGSMVAAAKQNPGGMRAYALRDTFARAINPGAVARVGTIQAIKDSQGIPAEVKGFFMNLQGDGNVPPEIAQQILDITQGFVASHYRGAQQLVQSNADYAKRHQIAPEDVTVPLGDAPQRFQIPTPAAAPPPPNPVAAQAAAAAAEIARRKAAGIWKGP